MLGSGFVNPGTLGTGSSPSFLIWSTISASAPYEGAEIQLWYAYEAPIIMQATDAQSIASYPGPNGGVFSEFISDSSLTTPTMALARAQQDRTEYAYPVQRVTFNTSPWCSRSRGATSTAPQ